MSSLSQAQVASTPVRQITTAGPPTADSPGNWKHPRLAEIARRQSKNTFSERNIRQVVYNTAALVALGLVRQVLAPLIPAWLFVPPSPPSLPTIPTNPPPASPQPSPSTPPTPTSPSS